MATTTMNQTDVAQGMLLEKGADSVKLALPGTDYKLDLATSKPVKSPVGRRVTGRIVARARRVDVVGAGGRFIEPVMGRPRQIQGAIVGLDEAAGAITVYCGCPIVAKLMAPQTPADFQLGQLVNFSIDRGARFEPVEA